MKRSPRQTQLFSLYLLSRASHVRIRQSQTLQEVRLPPIVRANYGSVAESADATDLKSVESNLIPVQFRAEPIPKDEILTSRFDERLKSRPSMTRSEVLLPKLWLGSQMPLLLEE